MPVYYVYLSCKTVPRDNKTRDNKTRDCRYYKTFKEQHKLYIVMQHIDGAPLQEHFSSLREKGLSFNEDRIWKIFVQVGYRLRYV